MNAQTNALIEEIAKKYLNISTLRTREDDALDFHDCPVWDIKMALAVAYRKGRADAHRQPT